MHCVCIVRIILTVTCQRQACTSPRLAPKKRPPATDRSTPPRSSCHGPSWHPSQRFHAGFKANMAAPRGATGATLSSSECAPVRARTGPAREERGALVLCTRQLRGRSRHHGRVREDSSRCGRGGECSSVYEARIHLMCRLAAGWCVRQWRYVSYGPEIQIGLPTVHWAKHGGRRTADRRT